MDRNAFHPSEVAVIYRSEDGEEYTQTVSDIAEVGTLIDPETGDDMEIIRVEIIPG